MSDAKWVYGERGVDNSFVEQCNHERWNRLCLSSPICFQQRRSAQQSLVKRPVTALFVMHGTVQRANGDMGRRGKRIQLGLGENRPEFATGNLISADATIK